MRVTANVPPAVIMRLSTDMRTFLSVLETRHLLPHLDEIRLDIK
jgi:hypothetical protein